MLDWISVYPERLDRKSRILWAGQSIVDPTVLLDLIQLDKWAPSYPSILFQKSRPVSTEWITVDPYIDHIPESFYIDKWLPTYPNRISSISRPLWTGISVIDPGSLVVMGTFGETILIDKWMPEYPPSLFRKPSIFCSGWTIIDPYFGSSPILIPLFSPLIEVPPKYESYIRKWLGDP